MVLSKRGGVVCRGQGGRGHCDSCFSCSFGCCIYFLLSWSFFSGAILVAVLCLDRVGFLRGRLVFFFVAVLVGAFVALLVAVLVFAFV